MKMRNKINIILAIVALVVSSVYLFKYYTTQNRLKQIYSELSLEQTELAQKISKCESIAAVKSAKPQYDDIFGIGKEIEVFPDKYSRLVKDIDDLQLKLMSLVSHSAMILDKYEIRKDVFSNEVLFGVENYILILCGAYELKINSNPIKVERSNEYTLPKMRSMDIEYTKYVLNYHLNRIDTLRFRRLISLQ